MKTVVIEANSALDPRKDAERLLERTLRAGRAENPRTKAREGLRAALAYGSPAAVFLLRDSDDTAAGICVGNVCCGIETGGADFWINEIYVIPERRRRGYGRKLLQDALTWAQTRQCRRALGWRLTDNLPSQRLFESSGFICQQVSAMELSPLSRSQSS
ncbi:MAG: GNAT family N-acetyltransferase [Candidatus Zixiibacteriota bacterium]